MTGGILVVTPVRWEELLASGGSRPGVLPHILHLTGRPTTKNAPAPHTRGAKVEKPWPRIGVTGSMTAPVGRLCVT